MERYAGQIGLITFCNLKTCVNLRARLVGGNEGEGMRLISIHGLVGGIPLKWDSQSHLSGNDPIPPHPLVLAIH